MRTRVARGLGLLVGIVVPAVVGRQALAGELYTAYIDNVFVGPTHIASIDPRTGVVSPIGPPRADISIEGLAYDSRNGVLYASTLTRGGAGADAYDLSRIDPATGAVTRVGSMGRSIVAGLAYDSRNDVLYAATGGRPTPALAVVDRATGAATPVGIGQAQSGASSLEYLPDADRLVYSSFDAASSHFGYYDRDTGSQAPIPGSAFGGGIFGMGFDSSTGTLYALPGGAYLQPGNQLYAVDRSTGAVTPARTLSHTAYYSSMTFVPEPAAPAAAVVVAWAYLLRRRRTRGTV